MSLPAIAEARPRNVLSVAVIGNDTVLAALPAHPIQLAHGCHLLGYHTVVPASWGDELVADAVLRAACSRGRGPAIVCACDRARSRLTTGAGELRSFLIPTVAPPVATARYLRQILAHQQLDITFVGDCASGADPVFDARYSPDVFLVRLRSAGIELTDLPPHFENLVPPDRRRHHSLPGGCPSAEALQRTCPDRQLVELTDSNLATELADQLMAQRPVLVDVAAGVGCSCAGVRRTGSTRTARIAVTSLEPPPSRYPILEGDALFETSTSVNAPNLRGLLARDPKADERPGEVEGRPTAEQAVSSVSSPASVEIDASGRETVIEQEAPTLVLLRSTPEAYAGPSIEVPPQVASPRRTRFFAVTPSRALRALHDRPGFSVPRLDRPARTPFIRTAAREALDSPVELVVQPELAQASAAVPVEPAVADREVVDQQVAGTETHDVRMVEARVDAARVGAKPVEPGRSHLPPPAPPPFLVEDPIAKTQRAAQARIVERARHVQPPATADRSLQPPATTGRLLVRAIVWTIIVLTIFTLAVLSATRGR